MTDLPNRRPTQPPPLVRAAIDEDRWRRQLIESIGDLQAAMQLLSERVDRIADATLTRTIGRHLSEPRHEELIGGIGWDTPMATDPAGEEPALPNMPDVVRDKLYAHLSPFGAGDGSLTGEERGAAPNLTPCKWCRSGQHASCSGSDMHGLFDCPCSCETARTRSADMPIAVEPSLPDPPPAAPPPPPVAWPEHVVADIDRTDEDPALGSGPL